MLEADILEVQSAASDKYRHSAIEMGMHYIYALIKIIYLLCTYYMVRVRMSLRVDILLLCTCYIIWLGLDLG